MAGREIRAPLCGSGILVVKGLEIQTKKRRLLVRTSAAILVIRLWQAIKFT